jgi:hypothetical protein
VISRAKFKWFFQALLISAVMLAPVFGQIHKIVHGHAVLHILANDHDHDHDHDHDYETADRHVAEQSLFSDHEEGSLLCLALDHLASGEGLQTLSTSVAIVESKPLYLSVESEPVFTERLLAFSARAPPLYL